jgi:hypothetical protein
MPAISKSSIVTADSELKQAATVPRLAAKILRERNYFLKIISIKTEEMRKLTLPQTVRRKIECDRTRL